MTKSELITKIADKRDLPRRVAEASVNTFFQSIKDALGRGDKVELRGFGCFKPKQYEAYKGRNPRTGTPVEVPPKTLPTFRVGKDLRMRVDASRKSKG